MVGRLSIAALLLLFTAPMARAATYEVGPGKPYATPSAVPWESLLPGDLVPIHFVARALRLRPSSCAALPAPPASGR